MLKKKDGNIQYSDKPGTTQIQISVGFMECVISAFMLFLFYWIFSGKSLQEIFQ